MDVRHDAGEGDLRSSGEEKETIWGRRPSRMARSTKSRREKNSGPRRMSLLRMQM